MTTLYHGTRYEHALHIGREGMLLSPFEQCVRDELEGKRKPRRQEAQRLAQMHLKRIYAEHELVHRGHSVSLTTDFRLAKDYAAHYESVLSRGGVILEFGISSIPKEWNDTGVMYEDDKGLCAPVGTIYLPERWALDRLTAIHFTPQAWEEENFEVVAQAFEKYGVDYFPI